MENRVVITGMGIYSCLGTSLDEVTESLRKGKSGIVYDEERKEYGFKSALTGKVPTPDLKNILNRRQRITIGEETEYAYMSTIQALGQANISHAYLQENEVGILFGNDSVSRAVIEATDIVREKKDTTLIGSGAIFKSMNSTVTMNLSTLLQLKGVNMTISAACASGSHAVGLAYLMIKGGLQDMVICGGAQEINKYAMASFDGLGVFSNSEDQPTKASRPFDKNRDRISTKWRCCNVDFRKFSVCPEKRRPNTGRSRWVWILIEWRAYLYTQCRWTYVSDAKSAKTG